MIRICPSILNANFDDLPGEIRRVAEVADLLHLDVMDGEFVPNVTFDLQRSTEIINASALPVDVHLMIANADTEALPYARTNAVSITVHYEACSDPVTTVRNIRKLSKRVGLAIKPATLFEEIEPLLSEIDMLLVMTVEPGFGGQKFMEEMLPKVAAARKWLTQKGLDSQWLQVDGGINEETIKLAAKAGADTFVAGSVVYRSDNPSEMIESLRRAASASE